MTRQGHRIPLPIPALLAALVFLLAGLAAGASAQAATPYCPTGAAAGQCSSPEGLATDFDFDGSGNGRLYVADKGNNRVDVFSITPAGAVTFSFAFGWKVNATTPEEKLQTCTTATGCLKGQAGSGAGQLSEPAWIAVDNSSGPSRHDVYVTDSNHRVSKFSSAGAFQWTAGSGVNTGTSGNPDLCTNAGAPTDVCKAGAGGTTLGAFETIAGTGIDGSGNVYVVDTKDLGNCEGQVPLGREFVKRVQRFNESGTPLSELKPTDQPCGQVAGFAVETNGAYWLATDVRDQGVRRYAAGDTAAGCSADPQLETKGIGLDAAGRLFAAQREPSRNVNELGPLTIGELDSSCVHLRRFGYGEIPTRLFGLAAFHSPEGDVLGSERGGNREVLYLKFPPAGPIATKAEDASNIGNTKATVRGEINPEGKETHYVFQFVSKADYEANLIANGDGFVGTGVSESESKVLATPDGEFRSNLTDPTLAGCQVATEKAIEEGKCLAPQTTYRWRLIATNADDSSGIGLTQKEGPPFTTKPAFEAESFDTAVGLESATLSARVNPLGIPTTGYFEYVTEAAYRADKQGGGDGFATATQIPDVAGGQSPLDFGSGEAFANRSVTLTGLAEATAYRYRFVAEDQLLPPLPSEEVGAFLTYRAPSGEEACPENQAYRTGPAAALPDCRAYEMVSPLDKEGADIAVLLEALNRPALLTQSAISGDRLAYGSSRAFAGALSGPYTSQYIAQRTDSGWQTHGINPPRGKSIRSGAAATDTELRQLSPDLCEAIWTPYADPPLAPPAPSGYINLFRQTDTLCGGDPDYEAISYGQPEGILPGPKYEVVVQGVSAAGAVTAFAANAALAGTGAPPQASPGSGTYLYVHGKGQAGPPTFACVLPNQTKASACSAGTGVGGIGLRRTRVDSVRGALSQDGQRLYWSAAVGQGKIYLRQNPLGEGGECSGPEAPCTIAVSAAGEAQQASSTARFWGASLADGARAVYSTGSALYEYTVEGAITHKIAGASFGVLGISADATRIYFASGEALSGPDVTAERCEADLEGNPLCYTAQPGKPNLYYYDSTTGKYRFIATLAAADVNSEPENIDANASSVTSPFPQSHNGQAASDGTSAIFMSTAPLTGFDNTDASSPRACASGSPQAICDTEAFVYDASADGGEGELLCISCNPGGGRPEGKNISIGNKAFWTAGRLPVGETTLYQPRALSANGRRVIFESADPLSSRDSNGRVDVYQWERAGEGGCEEGDASFSARAGGCISLISSGQSVRDSELLDASPDGRDVFFTTLSGLVTQDYGLLDVYDARIGGGLPSPEPPPPGCEGEACLGAYVPPGDPTPASASFHGTGNVVEPPVKPAKRKTPKVKKKGKCVKPKPHKKKGTEKHKCHHRRGRGQR